MQLGNHLQKLSLGYYKKRDPGDLAAVVLQDVANLEHILGHTIGNMFGAFFATIFTSIFLISLDWKLSLLMLSVIPLTAIFMFIGSAIVAKFGVAQIDARNATGSRFIEYIQGIRHLKAYNQTGVQFKAMEKAFDDLRKASIKTEAIPGPFILTAIILFELMFLWMVYFGLDRFEVNELSITVLVAFLIIGYRLYEPLKLILVDFAILRYMNVSLKRIVDLLESPIQSSGKDLMPSTYEIDFHEVHFSYTSQKVLDGVSCTIPSGKITALVGASGSGKTTIANLIARFWDTDQGRITIGGVNLRDMSIQTIYGLISEVFQDVYLFDDSIFNNIKIGNPEATEEDIMNVAQRAQVLEFIDKLPKGIHTKVGEGGSRLSGGQKQRISIARAMLKDAPIVLLDEATASLDPENEIYIQRALQELVKTKTVVVIAHKLQTVRRADQILVLEKGGIVEHGRHEDLMKNQKLYAKSWNIQQSTRGWKFKK